jgi:excisionase family DNA binding protein
LEQKAMTKIPTSTAFMSVREVAAHFGCGVSTVWRWDRTGVLPKSVKIGGMTRWRRSEIDALLADNAA